MTTTNNAPISFRLTDDELELLRQHQEDGEKSLNLTAKRLLLNALGVDAKKPSIQVVNSVDMVHVQELIETAVQEKLEKLTIVDNVDTIKNLIAESLADGVIGEAIAKNYEAMMGQFNGLLEELQELQKQLQELKSIPPAPGPQSPINEELTTDNEQLTKEILTEPPKTDDGQFTEELESDSESLLQADRTDSVTDNDQIIKLLKIERIAGGELYNAETLKADGIFDAISENQNILEQLTGEKLTLKQDTGDINKILKFMGYTTERTTKNGKKYNRVK